METVEFCSQSDLSITNKPIKILGNVRKVSNRVWYNRLIMARLLPSLGSMGKRRHSKQQPETDLEAQIPTTEEQDLQKSRDKTAQVDQQVQEVTAVMQDNVRSVQERGENLENLEEKTARLQESSSQFNKNATTVKKNLKWKQMRRAIIIAVVVIVILAIAGGVAAVMMKKKRRGRR